MSQVYHIANARGIDKCRNESPEESSKFARLVGLSILKMSYSSTSFILPSLSFRHHSSISLPHGTRTMERNKGSAKDGPLTTNDWRLPFPTSGKLLLITDQLAASGEFLLHRALGVCLKHRVSSAMGTDEDEDKGKGKDGSGGCVLVSLTEDWEHWRAIGAKSVSPSSLPWLVLLR